MAQQLLRDREIVRDEWHVLDAESALPASGQVIVELAHWQELGAPASGDALQIGVRLPNTEDVEALWPALSALPMIVLEFPLYSDGRAYSQARLLRDRLGYRGRLRAQGEVIRDQVLEMHRCGFDEIVPRADQSLEDCLRAFKDFSLAYQGAADGQPNIFRRRHA